MEKSTEKSGVVWRGRPSHWYYFPQYLLVAILAIPTLGISLLYGLYLYFKIKTTAYTLSNTSLTRTSGVFSRETHELMLYRVQDVVKKEPFFLRLVNLCDIVILATDRVDNVVVLKYLSNGEKVRKALRVLSEKERVKKGVRAIDIVRD